MTAVKHFKHSIDYALSFGAWKSAYHTPRDEVERLANELIERARRGPRFRPEHLRKRLRPRPGTLYD